MGSFAINGNQGKAIPATEKNWQHCQEFKNYKFYKDSINFFNYVLHYITLYVIVLLKKGENIMTLITEKETKSYKDGAWRVDIETDKYMYNAWIYHKQYGIKMQMWGIEKKNDTYDNFFKMICEALPEYKKAYEEKFI